MTEPGRQNSSSFWIMKDKEGKRKPIEQKHVYLFVLWTLTPADNVLSKPLLRKIACVWCVVQKAQQSLPQLWNRSLRTSQREIHGYSSSALLQILGVGLEIKKTVKVFCIPLTELLKASNISVRNKNKFRKDREERRDHNERIKTRERIKIHLKNY